MKQVTVNRCYLIIYQYRKRIRFFCVIGFSFTDNFFVFRLFVLTVPYQDDHMGAAIIIRTTVVTRHSVHTETLDNKTAKPKRRTQFIHKWRKGKFADFEMVSEKPLTVLGLF